MYMSADYLNIEGLGKYDEACLKAIYEIQLQSGAIPYMTFEEYKVYFKRKLSEKRRDIG